MKIPKKITKYVLFWRKEKSVVSPPQGPHPERDWITLLVGFVVFNVVIIVFNIFLFQQVIDGELFSSELTETSPVETLEEKDLNKTLDLFREKEQRFLSLGGMLPSEVAFEESATSSASTTPKFLSE